MSGVDVRSVMAGVLEVVVVAGVLGAWWCAPGRCLGMAVTALVLAQVVEDAPWVRRARRGVAGLRPVRRGEG